MELKELELDISEKKQQIKEKVQSINTVARTSVRTGSQTARFTKQSLTSSQMREGEDEVENYSDERTRNRTFKNTRKKEQAEMKNETFEYRKKGNTFEKPNRSNALINQSVSPWEEKINSYKNKKNTPVTSNEKSGEDFPSLVKNTKQGFMVDEKVGMKAGINSGMNTGTSAGIGTGVKSAAKGGAFAKEAASGAATGGISTAVSAGIGIVKKASEKGKQIIKESVENNKKNKEKVSSNFLAYIFTLPMIILIVVILVVASVSGALAYSSTVSEELAIVKIAKRELAQSEENVGGKKYKSWYGVNGNWCAMFVSFCADECDLIDSGVMPKTASVSNMLEWYKDNHQFEKKIDEDGEWYIPKAGDIIIFKSSGASHVGIVINYDEDSGKVTTIEGNAGRSDTEPYHEGSRVKECNYALSYSKITGYGIPNYPVGTIPESTETEIAKIIILEYDVPKFGTLFVLA